MKRKPLYTAVTAALLFAAAGAGMAQDQDQTRDRTQTRTQTREEPIYGSQLMTQQERIEYRNRMRAAKTAQEREQIRLEHHKQMQERARERGVTLPDMPPARGPGRGMGPGSGSGPGMGPGSGMGPGPRY